MGSLSICLVNSHWHLQINQCCRTSLFAKPKAEVCRKSDVNTNLLVCFYSPELPRNSPRSSMCSCIDSPVACLRRYITANKLISASKDSPEETIPPRHLRHRHSAPPSQHPRLPSYWPSNPNHEKTAPPKPISSQSVVSTHHRPALCLPSKPIRNQSTTANILRDLGVRVLVLGDRHYNLQVSEDFPPQTLFQEMSLVQPGRKIFAHCYRG